jgi:hypothetical protein
MTNHTISGTYFQTSATGVVACVLCGQHISPAGATSGPTDAAGQLTFICGAHLRDSRQIISTLADYRAAQRERLIQNINISEADLDAWFSY